MQRQRSIVASLLLLLVPMVGVIGSVSATTTPTHVVSNQTWAASGNPYLIDDMLVIMPGNTLTIEEGVEVYFTPNGWLDVRGDLNILGTATNPVLMTIDSGNATSTSQYWGGIQLNTDDFDVDFVMRNTTISRASSGVGIDCCHQGSILIEDSVFSENNIAISGYAGDTKAYIDNVLFSNNQVGVDSADKIITNSTFSENGHGIISAERIDVSFSLFDENDIAAYGGRGLLYCNVIEDNRIGVKAFFQGWALEYNLIQDNSEVGMIVGQYGGNVPHATYNTFLNNGMGTNGNGISVDHTNNININFEDNYWGTTSTAVIDAAISDFFDNSNLGLVTYSPILTAAPSVSDCDYANVGYTLPVDNGSSSGNNTNGTGPCAVVLCPAHISSLNAFQYQDTHYKIFMKADDLNVGLDYDLDWAIVDQSNSNVMASGTNSWTATGLYETFWEGDFYLPQGLYCIEADLYEDNVLVDTKSHCFEYANGSAHISSLNVYENTDYTHKIFMKATDLTVGLDYDLDWAIVDQSNSNAVFSGTNSWTATGLYETFWEGDFSLQSGNYCLEADLFEDGVLMDTKSHCFEVLECWPSGNNTGSNNTGSGNNNTVPGGNNTGSNNNTGSGNNTVPSGNNTGSGNNNTVPSGNNTSTNNNTGSGNNNTVPSGNNTGSGNNNTVPSGNNTGSGNNNTVPSGNNTGSNNTGNGNNNTVPSGNNTGSNNTGSSGSSAGGSSTGSNNTGSGNSTGGNNTGSGNGTGGNNSSTQGGNMALPSLTPQSQLAIAGAGTTCSLGLLGLALRRRGNEDSIFKKLE